MVDEAVQAVTTDEKARQKGEAELDDMLRPQFAESNRYMTGDGTIDNPVKQVDTPAGDEKPTAPNPFDTEYAAASNASEKANVAAKHGHFQEAFGNSQNIVGEMRGQLDELRSQRDTLLQQAAQAPPQATPQPTPQQALANHQFVQPKDEYDTEAQRMNELGRAITTTLAAGIDQAYGGRFQEVVTKLENLERMPNNYTVDTATEAQILREAPHLQNLPAWQQKDLIQRIAGTQSNNTPPARTRTPQERKVGQAVNYIEPSDSTAAPLQSEEGRNARMWREYQDARAAEKVSHLKTEAGRKVLLKYGFKEEDDWR